MKIPSFLRNVSKMFFKKIQKNLKKFEISFLFQKTKKQKQKKFCFHAYGQILKVLQNIFS